MSIYYHENTKTFHLTNGAVSYLMKVLPNGALGQLYFGQAIRDREDFDHLLEMRCRPMSSCVFEGCGSFSLEHCKQEYPSCGSTDFRHPAVELRQPNGSRITDFVYRSHTVTSGKPPLEGLPATYCEADGEAETLTVHLEDELLQTSLYLSYTLFAGQPVLARSARLENHGGLERHLTAAMSLSLDLPDSGYEFVHFSGAWSRERHMKVRRLEQGIQSVESARGHSSHNHNPFIMLRRPGADEEQGEVLGFSLVYSGNFLAQVEVDTWDTARVTLGINPFGFDWKLSPGGRFQTPEAVLVYSHEGLGAMTRTFHDLLRTQGALYREVAGSGGERPGGGAEDIARFLLQEDGEDTGAFLCELEVFRHICRLEARAASREKRGMFLAVLSAAMRDGSPAPMKLLNNYMDKLGKCVQSALRRGDAAARCSDAQYVLLLPAASREGCAAALTRIIGRFQERCPRCPMILRYEALALEDLGEEDRAL